MEHEEDNMTRKLALIAGIITILAVWLLLWLVILQRPPARPYDYDWPGKQRIVERMKFHGVWGAICEGEDCYFYRDGKRCRL